jgi:hypothetical protein
MELLRAQDQIHVGHLFDERLAAALGHATHEAKNLAGSIFCLADDGGHLTNCLLLREVPDGAGVDKHDVGDMFRTGQGISPGRELRGDGFAVALVHLTTVSLDINTRHVARVAGKLSDPALLEKSELRPRFN